MFLHIVGLYYSGADRKEINNNGIANCIREGSVEEEIFGLSCL